MRRVGTSKSGLVFELGGGLLVDTAGNNTVTNNGATLTTDHNGRANRGWVYNGSNGRILIPDNANIRRDGAFTWNTGIKPGDNVSIGVLSTSLANRFLLSVSSSAGDNVISMTQYLSNSILFSVSKSTTNLSSSLWYFVSFVIDRANSTAKIYVNGVDLGTLTTTFNVGLCPVVDLYVGYYYTSYRVLSKDHLSIFNRALTESEIKKLYNYWRSH